MDFDDSPIALPKRGARGGGATFDDSPIVIPKRGTQRAGSTFDDSPIVLPNRNKKPAESTVTPPVVRTQTPIAQKQAAPQLSPEPEWEKAINKPIDAIAKGVSDYGGSAIKRIFNPSAPVEKGNLGNQADDAVKKSLGFYGGARDMVGRAVAPALQASGLAPVISTVGQKIAGPAKQTGTALGNVLNGMSQTWAYVGGMADDLANAPRRDITGDPNKHDSALIDAYQRTGDAIKNRDGARFTENVERHGLTSMPTLRSIQASRFPVASQLAGALADHPLSMNLPATVALMHKTPSFENALQKSVGIAAKRAKNKYGDAVAQANTDIGEGMKQSGPMQTPPGRALTAAAEGAGKLGKRVNNEYQDKFGNPNRKLRDSAARDEGEQHGAVNAGQRYKGANQTGRGTAVHDVYHVFGNDMAPQERELAVDVHQVTAYKKAYDQFPSAVQQKAASFEKLWRGDLANKGESIVRPMHALPPNVEALHPELATAVWKKNAFNTLGVPADEQEDVMRAANYLHASRDMPDLSKLAPERATRVQDAAKKYGEVYQRLDNLQMATHPDLLDPTRAKIGYAPSRNLFEHRDDDAPVRRGFRSGGTVKDFSKDHAQYQTVAQIRNAGYDVYSGLKPEESLFKDLSRKYQNVEAVAAAHQLGALDAKGGGRILSTQEYIDPKTGESINAEEAKVRAKYDLEERDARNVAKDQGVQLDPKTLRPTFIPPRIRRSDSFKNRALELERQEKLDEKNVGKVDAAGRKFADVAVNAGLKSEAAGEQLAGNVGEQLEGIKGDNFNRAGNERAAFDKADARNEATQGKRDDAAERQRLYQDPAVQKQVQRDHGILADAHDKSQTALRGNVGAAGERAQRSINARISRVNKGFDSFMQRERDLSSYAIDETAKNRQRLNNIAQTSLDKTQSRLARMTANYYAAVADEKNLKLWNRMLKDMRASVSPEQGAKQIADHVENNYRVHEDHYINANTLEQYGIKIPGFDADRKLPRDVVDWFASVEKDKQVVQQGSDLIGEMNGLAKSLFVMNPTVHGVWNLGSNYLARTGDLAGLAAAMPMLLGTMFGKEDGFNAFKQQTDSQAALYYLKREAGVNQGGMSERLPYDKDAEIVRDKDGIRTGTQRDPDETSGLHRMVSRMEDLRPEDRARRIAEDIQRWNSRVVFDRFETWYAVKLFQKINKETGDPRITARQVRDQLGTDLLTPFEKQKIAPNFWFYPWFKTITKLAVATGIHNPRALTIPFQGAQAERQGMGAQDLQTGPFTLVMKDGQSFRTIEIPFPMGRQAGVLANFAYGTPGTKQDALDRIGPLAGEVLGHGTPMRRLGLELGAEALDRGKGPEYLQPIAADAKPDEAGKQLGEKVVESYAYPYQQIDDAGKVANTRGLAAALGEGAASAAGIRVGSKLVGANVGGPQEGTPAATFYHKRGLLQSIIDRSKPGSKKPDPYKYRQATRDLAALYRQFHQRPPR